MCVSGCSAEIGRAMWTLPMVAAAALAVCGAESLPNILILVADDLGIGDLSCYGNRSFTTPHLDRLAAEGALLTHHVATAAVCSPSRSALLTGRYPVRFGMQEARAGPPVVRNVFGTAGLPGEETTFARVLRDAGYQTQYVGKWHQGWSCERWDDQCHGPRAHGFQSFYGLPWSLQEEDRVSTPERRQRSEPFVRHVLPELLRAGQHAGNCSRPSAELAWRLWLDFVRRAHHDQGLEWDGHTYELDQFMNQLLVRDDTVELWPPQLPGLTQRLLAESQRFVLRAARASRPFLLVHSFLHTHTPLFTAPGFRNASGHSRYADNVLEMDWAVGRLLATLEATGVAGNTLVHFVSDQGGQLELEGADGQREGGHNGPFRGGKSQGGMEGGIRVPALFRWPGRVPAGRRVRAPTSALDLLPTLLDAAGLSAERLSLPVDGRSMLPLLEGRTEAATHRFLMHYCGDDVHAARHAPDDEDAVYKLYFKVPRWPDPAVQHCGRKDGICLCYGGDVIDLPTPQLFDVRNDPSETSPIATEDARYKRHVPLILRAVEEHKLRVVGVPSQHEEFDRVVSLPELVPWDQLSKYRGVDFDIHGMDDLYEQQESCPAVKD